MSAVIFDCDGVLVDSEVLALEIELAGLAELGLEFERDTYKKQFLGTSSADYFHEIERIYLKTFGSSLPEGFRDGIRNRWYEAFKSRLKAIPGVHAALDAIDVPMAVASGSSLAGLEVKLGSTGLVRPFGEHVYSASQVENGKPAPDLFLFAAGHLGVSPEDCFVVEDSVNGVRGAIAAGMRAIGFTGGAHCSPDHGNVLLEEGAVAVVAHMDDLAAALGLSPDGSMD